ncbi:MAG: hypothetical protein V7K81_22745 [Nostoc sp.]
MARLSAQSSRRIVVNFHSSGYLLESDAFAWLTDRRKQPLRLSAKSR